MLAAGALLSPRDNLRRQLAAHLPKGMRRGVRLRGGFDVAQGLQNPGSLLFWRLEDAQGLCHLAAVEKVVLTAVLGRLVPGLWTDQPTEWLKEAYFYQGLRPCVSQPDCHLPDFLGLRRGPGRLGLLLRDLRHDGWSEVATEELFARTSTLVTALADFTCDYSLAPPADSPRWHLPGYRPFFARLTDRKYENFARVVALANLPGRKCAALLDRMHALNRSWERRIEQASLPRILCHGDPHFRNFLTDAQGRVALLDMENYFYGPPGLDIGRFIGTSITRCLEALSNPVAAAPEAARVMPWTDAVALERFAETAEQTYLARLSARGLFPNPVRLRQLSRNTAAMSIFYSPVAWRRMAETAPALIRPALRMLQDWSR